MIILKFDNYILEKRIGQISANIEVIFAFDIIKTVHADDRSDFSKRNLSGENQTHISNGEIVNLISIFRREIHCFTFKREFTSFCFIGFTHFFIFF